MINRLPIVGVMGSGKDSWKELSSPLGEALGRRKVHLLTGGGQGVMTEVAAAFCSVPERIGISIGILPTEKIDGKFNLREGYPNQYIELPIITPLGVFDGIDGVNRNFVNILTADIVIALPGSQGTKNEVELAIKFKRPLVLFGPSEKTSELIEQRISDEKQVICQFDSLDRLLEWLDTQLTR